MSKSFLLFISGLILGSLFSFNGVSQSSSFQKEAILLKKALQRHHYSPKPFDDKLSEEVFITFFSLLDRRQIYFKAEDMVKLGKFKHQIDDELNGKSWTFIPEITAVYKKRLTDSEKIFSDVLHKPFDFSANDILIFPPKDSLAFASSDREYIERWIKWLKYDALWQMVYEEEELKEKSSSNPGSNESAIRQKLLNRKKRNLKRILEGEKGIERYVTELFFTAITSSFDPHTNYFSKEDLTKFQSSLSKEGLSYGMDLDENELGDVYISRLIPGGPAWKSSELHKGDILIEVKWDNKPMIDLSGADADEVSEIINASPTKKVELTVKKTNGQIKTISLAKGTVKDENNIVKSFILKGDKKIGYISLPGFYSEWENTSGSGCANDVAKEIIKLKEEKIEGLILDIRNNGGGALLEGLNLAGIFINEGPLFLIQERNKKITIMKDMNRGTIYDGPLLVMVNGQSASASEVLATIIQDFNRGIIVGNTTFGKATGQIIVPLDTTRPLNKQMNGSALKVTDEKLYRINGRSIQQKGVNPDIYLPDAFEVYGYSERSLPYSLPSDSVNKKVFFTPLKELPKSELAKNSTGRISSEETFNTIKVFINENKSEMIKSNSFPLNISAFREKARKSYKIWKTIEESGKESKLYEVSNTKYDQQLLAVDDYSKEINELIIENLKTDIYLEETFQIISDFITLSKN